jgi:hypothetical protein
MERTTSGTIADATTFSNMDEGDDLVVGTPNPPPKQPSTTWAPDNNSRRPGGLGFWIGTGLGALLGSAVGIFFVLPFGLIASEFVIFPLALGVAAILASLAAGWAGNWLASGRTRADLLRVVGVTELAATILAVGGLANSALRLVLLGPVIYVGLFCVLVLALTATAACWRFRTTKRAQSDGLITLGLLALAVVGVPVVVSLAWLVGLAGA